MPGDKALRVISWYISGIANETKYISKISQGTSVTTPRRKKHNSQHHKRQVWKKKMNFQRSWPHGSRQADRGKPWPKNITKNNTKNAIIIRVSDDPVGVVEMEIRVCIKIPLIPLFPLCHATQNAKKSMESKALWRDSGKLVNKKRPDKMHVRKKLPYLPLAELLSLVSLALLVGGLLFFGFLDRFFLATAATVGGKI